MEYIKACLLTKQTNKYNEEVRNTLIHKGYDGIVYSNNHEGKGSSMIVFNPADIKIVKKQPASDFL